MNSSALAVTVTAVTELAGEAECARLAGLVGRRDFTEIRAFASPSECISATIDDVNESLEPFSPLTPQKYSKCFQEMIAKGEKASINSLTWTLQEMLDLLHPVQEKCEAPPEPMLLFAGC
ncbi:hypothetical protein QYF61_013515 [Mycteria americana]|uniref:Uncharacterized protein n=1 Tax=Mycteria americana TaxID=33587 RepID=A0AAN7N770_MYCAM|nr:hypothetical protein QYF61_013515 [Mycteria americana]